MDIILFCNDIDLLGHWKTQLEDYEIIVIDKADNLPYEKRSIVICSMESLQLNLNAMSEYIKTSSHKIVVLDRNPTLNKARWLFGMGIDGYGNALSAKIYLQSAIDAVSKNLKWIVPDLTTQIIQNLTLLDNISLKNESLWNELTQKEKEIARFLKDGYSNMQISEKLNISINTVKTHIKHIYSKFSVKDKISFILLFK
ncbi:response regulator transcription factor [Arcobacter sp. FWKO B]|uniref:response regulator transcription factor n=1 Tax=Arcobacter sp. FWKO B TaxID=2593672 RepID=UPI0018A69D15|nr:LuxR C-terminal-related transcriptional regulator [Arcobacter sp. FWKO B]QOG11364.1 response regulator transcription factor [Arcobacter sp. FWKO B]